MRYKIGEDPQQLPFAHHSSDDTFTGTAIYGLLLGLGFIIVGLKARQRWLAFWGAGLSVASIASLVVML